MTRNLLFGAVVGVGAVAMLAYKAVCMNRHRAQFIHDDELVNQSIDDSFPASDPPSYTPASAMAVRQ